MVTTSYLNEDKIKSNSDILEGLSCRHIYLEPDDYAACVGTCAECGIAIHNRLHEDGIDLEFCTWREDVDLAVEAL